MNRELLESLHNPETAVAYLNKALENNSPAALVQALRYVVEAHGGVEAISKKGKIMREQLELILAEENKPKFVNIQLLLQFHSR